MQSKLNKFMFFIVGNIIAACGIILCLNSNLGIDPLSTFYSGVANLTKFNFGYAAFLVNMGLLLICLLFDKRSIKIGTILCNFIFPYFLNYWGNILSGLSQYNVHYTLLLSTGILLTGIGFSFTIFSDLGPSCIDLLLTILVKKSGMKIKTVKIFLDFTFTLLGLMLGAKIGIGTILCVALIGVIYETTINILNRVSFVKLKSCGE